MAVLRGRRGVLARAHQPKGHGPQRPVLLGAERASGGDPGARQRRRSRVARGEKRERFFE